MEANINSLHVKLYRFTFKPLFYKEHDLPTNLCPYFWKLLFAVLVFIPNLILQLPILVYSLFKDQKMSCNERRSFGLLTYFGIIFLLSYIYGTIDLVKALIGSNYNEELVFIGGILNLVILILIIVFIMIKISERNQYKQDNIVTSFIKAKYNNYCPKINWN